MSTGFANDGHYQCPDCSRMFSHKHSLTRHLNTVHLGGVTSTCNECGKVFGRLDSLKRHMRTHDISSIEKQKTIVPHAYPSSENVEDLTTPMTLNSNANTQRFNDIASLSDIEIHNVDSNYATDNVDPVKMDNNELNDLLTRYWSSIKTYHKAMKVTELFNFRLIAQTRDIEIDLLEFWRDCIKHRVKINVSPGYVLQHKTSNELRYFHSSINNTSLFDKPFIASSTSDLRKFISQLKEVDIMEWSRLRRPSTTWQIHSVTNITFYFFKITNMPKIGVAPVLPPYISRNKAILSLNRDVHHGNTFTDNLCFFRCLSIALRCKCTSKCKCSLPQESHVKRLFNTYRQARDLSITIAQFRGVTLRDLLLLERLFEISITVFELKPDRTCNILWHSKSSHQQKLNLNLYDKHFSYIKHIDLYSGAYQCEQCDKLFTRLSHLKRHKCDVLEDRLKYPKQCYAPSSTIFEKLETELGIVVNESLRFYPFRATFDIECYTSTRDLPDPTQKMEFSSCHELMSISICSNIPGVSAPQCLVSYGDTEALIADFVNTLLEMSELAASLLFERYHNVFRMIDQIAEIRHNVEKEFEGDNMSCNQLYASRSVESFRDMFKTYLQQLPVVGFNSQRYDLRVLRGPLLKHLYSTGKIKYTIKRETKMQCIQTDRLKFVDICNFIAPGFSYENYIKAFECKLQKGYFPYEYVDSLQRLEETSLPPHSAFYSSLKMSNISEEEYAYCQRVWNDNNMTCLGEFLVWYNNLDVVPFLEAIEKQSQIYRSKGIDMLKDAISLPGLAVKWKFTEVDRNQFFIQLIDEKNSDLYKTIKENLVGGPSIVFHRYHESFVTKLRHREMGHGAKLCKRILGFDANALYLWSLTQEIPTGFMIRRRDTDAFKPRLAQKYGKTALGFLEYVAWKESIYIEYQFNKGERRIGQHGLPVDGFCKQTNTVYEFHGCLFHGHRCELTKNVEFNPINGKLMEELEFKTYRKEQYIEALGYNLIVMRECQWYQILRSEPEVKDFVDNYFERVMITDNGLSEIEIIQAVRDGRFFGFIECDIVVPECLRVKFSEMPPIFKNVKLDRSSLSEHMREFAENSGHLNQPQRMLIGSMIGKKIMLLSKLAQWYLQQGLVITKVYQTIQYTPVKCFARFGQNVSDARRMGDVDPSKALLAETNKLIGNSVYGKTITNKEHHKKIRYSDNNRNVSNMIRSDRFLSLEELCDDFYEVVQEKTRITLDTPVAIGFTVLQYAKLRMLQFYYDFMDSFIDRSDFQYVCMDTDSAYMAISGIDIDSVVKPDKLDQFYQNYGDWFPRPFCPEHKTSYIDCKKNSQKWNMQDCCKNLYKYDKRTPGLFKEEFIGTGIVALNSKTYYCWSDDNNTYKISTKGISKSLNKYDKDQFLSVLNSKTPINGINRGFIPKGANVFTYQQLRTGLTYFYAKRMVHSDGVSTEPLNL